MHFLSEGECKRRFWKVMRIVMKRALFLRFWGKVQANFAAKKDG
jgi:hypothetical protein